MKRRLAILNVVLFSCITVTSVAQSNQLVKVPLFKSMPRTITCTSLDLNNFFAFPKGQQKMQTSISGQLDISGTVISNTAKYNKLFTMAIKLSAYNDAIFSISKRIDENNKPVFTGHIFQQNSADGYELKKNADDTYQFVKINMDEILPACTQL
ncbi:hypothetical protein LK994_11265 [Ferruginibacter lapsinanis]|uniref:hypothetical protein n=1 Tax=Ferruginibacter lapsinanis TaxID=563172 RepID=UPI001E2C4965|nr:hypothetical protein [Ferruginibacter lapsinanis]UEG49209.1 hypothetical protein LK994_11265 [Ferruginibacter lapsinanis]